MHQWTPPAAWPRLTSLDAHTAGEPLRIVTSGFPSLRGDTILAKRQEAKERFDALRKLLMWEPRGHADMYGAILTEATTPDGDFGVLFLHNEGFSTMCGHGIIALTKAAVETGLYEAQGDRRTLRIDTPAGRVTSTAHLEDGRVRRVSFQNVPSFVYRRDAIASVEGLGDVRYDIAYGGAFYAYVDAHEVGVSLEPEHQRHLIDVGMKIKHAVMETTPLKHPDGDPDLEFLYGTIFIDLQREGVHSRNVCIFAEGEVDRSPTGTGVSGRLALHYDKGDIGLDEPITIESLIGTRFGGRVLRETTLGTTRGIVPEVSGTSSLTGRHEFFLDPDDDLPEGFLLR